MDSLSDIIRAIDHFISSQTNEECSEHDIIQYLRSECISPFDQLDIKQSKELFSAHFLCMHALYHLQNRYHEQQSYLLEITLTRISRLTYSFGKAALGHHDELKSYYLDISHYFETSEDDVNQLLDNFWRKFLSHDDKSAALKTLELPLEADYSTIKKQYRRLAQKHHPDKGGSNEFFAKINAAKSLLDKAFS